MVILSEVDFDKIIDLYRVKYNSPKPDSPILSELWHEICMREAVSEVLNECPGLVYDMVMDMEKPPANDPWWNSQVSYPKFDIWWTGTTKPPPRFPIAGTNIIEQPDDDLEIVEQADLFDCPAQDDPWWWWSGLRRGRPHSQIIHSGHSSI